jgi:outer membrane protein
MKVSELPGKRVRLIVTCPVILLFMVLFIVPGTEVGAQQISTVGVVNITQVYNSFYRDSQAVRDLERLRRQYQQEIDDQVRDLENLRDRLFTARSSGNDRRADQLEEQSLEMQRFLEDLTSRRRQQLEARQQQLLSDEFLQRLQSAIQFVAESEGFSLVIRSDADGLQWWSSEVDVSNQVLQRLIQISDR